VRNPDRSISEKPVVDSELIREEQTKPKAQQARAKCESLMKVNHPLGREFKRSTDCCSDEAHSNDYAKAEDPEINRHPKRTGNGAEYEQRNGGAASGSFCKLLRSAPRLECAGAATAFDLQGINQPLKAVVHCRQIPLPYRTLSLS
jgi:hypothetical protein